MSALGIGSLTLTHAHTHVHAQEWGEKEGQRKRTIEDELDLLAMNLAKIFLCFYIFLKLTHKIMAVIMVFSSIYVILFL